MKIKSNAAPVLFCTLLGVVLLHLPSAIADRHSDYEWFDPILDVHRILADNYVQEPDADLMQRATIDGMIDSLQDRYTQYIPPADTDIFTKQLRGSYAGIGAEVRIEEDYLTIISPMDDSPALHAGVRAGDVVLTIESESTEGKSIEDCVGLLSGPVGTSVSITVRHEEGEEEALSITRQPITTPTVKGLRRNGLQWDHCVDEDLGLYYYRIEQFNSSTVNELRNEMQVARNRGLNGMILDLRDNPGGGLPSAIAMADMFLTQGIIVSVRPRSGEEQVFHASKEGTLPDFPLIVMINGESASASEIVSGALKENNRARIIGSRSFGKGSVQEVRPLNYGTGTLKYTTAYYYLSDGRNLHRRSDSAMWGVDPSLGYVIPISQGDHFSVLRQRRAHEILRPEQVYPGHCLSPDWIRDSIGDKLLAMAVEALAIRLQTSEWPILSDAQAMTEAFDEELAHLSNRRTGLMRQLDRVEDNLNELHGLAVDAGRDPLLPDTSNIMDGTISVRDSLGNLLGVFRITGGDVEMALGSLQVQRVENEEQDPEGS